MKRILTVLFLVTILAFSRVLATESCGEVPAGDTGVIEAKAKELVTGKNTRLEKISAIHSFVRDEIGQAKTQYG